MERQADFRSSSPSHVTSASAPRTGLSMLMNGSIQPQSSHTGVTPATVLSTMATSSAESTRRFDEEMIDRERQASALAAAGMVAESVSLAGRGQVPQVLQAPPPLAAGAGGPVSTELESINWNLMDLGAMHLDDMDLDFAQLFDPACELASMQAEGSGWPPSTASLSDNASLPVAPPSFPPTNGNTS